MEQREGRQGPGGEERAADVALANNLSGKRWWHLCLLQIPAQGERTRQGDGRWVYRQETLSWMGVTEDACVSCPQVMGDAGFLFGAASRVAMRRWGDWWPEVLHAPSRTGPGGYHLARGSGSSADLTGKIRGLRGRVATINLIYG